MKRSYIIATVVAVGVAGWILSGQIGESSVTEGLGPDRAIAEEVLPRVRVRTMAAETHQNEILLFGRTEAERKVDVMAETSGRVAKVLVEKGERVKQGQVLVRLAMDDRKARLDEAEALVEQQTITYEAAQKLSKKQFRSAVTLAENKADLEAARAELEAIKLDIQRSAIRAPFAGVVDRLPAEEGLLIAVGSPVARIVDLDPVLVVGEVAERNVGKIEIGTLAVVRLISGQEVGGTVRYVSNVASEATRTFRVEIEVDNPDGSIVEGLTTQLQLPLGRVQAHRMSPAVLTLSKDGVVGIKTVGEGGKVKFHAANLVADTPEGMWLGGLPETLTLITVGQEFVREGEKVVAVPEEEIEQP